MTSEIDPSEVMSKRLKGIFTLAWLYGGLVFYRLTYVYIFFRVIAKRDWVGHAEYLSPMGC